MKATKKDEESGKTIQVGFSYSESCKNCYKSQYVIIDGKRSNIRGLKKYVKGELPFIMTASTFFWKSGSAASQRRHNEYKRESEVEAFLMENGFEIVEP